MEVWAVQNLPDKFRPPPGVAPTTEDVPAPVAELIREATSGLTGLEQEVFLRRLRERHPGLFSGETGKENQQLPEGLTEGEWREELTRLLKEEANRFMAAAASL